jgi:hypothetical protein
VDQVARQIYKAPARSRGGKRVFLTLKRCSRPAVPSPCRLSLGFLNTFHRICANYSVSGGKLQVNASVSTFHIPHSTLSHRLALVEAFRFLRRPNALPTALLHLLQSDCVVIILIIMTLDKLV